MARVVLTIRALVQKFFNEAIDPRVPRLYFNIKERLSEKDNTWEEMLEEAYKVNLDSRRLPKL